MGTIRYNPSIDGLRAISVIAVVVYHINKEWLPGGFLGVDIFFTISGFLITSIIYKEKSSGSFSYINFYRRRINRILPVYFFVLAATLIASYFILLPYDMYKFGGSAASSILFSSNFMYALRTGDYFSNHAEQWPLLHTWSLSVEEQFYIVWPIAISFLFFLHRSSNIKNANLNILIVIPLIILTAALGTIMSLDGYLHKWSYYLFITRANELLVGAAAAIILFDKNKLQICSLITNFALLGLVLCLFIYSKDIVFPGASALIPCSLAAILLIPSEKSASQTLLSTKPLVFIGLLSYSLYLWHWPIIAFTKYIFDFEQDTSFSFNAYSTSTVVILVLLLSIFSYRFVESPARHNRHSFKISFIMFFLVPSAILLTIALTIIYTRGMPDRFSSPGFDPNLAFYHIDKNRCPDFVNLGCEGGIPNTEAPLSRFLLVGNSHAEHFFELVSQLGSKFNIQVDIASAGGCSPVSRTLKCLSVRNYVFSNLNKYDGFIYAQKWGSEDFIQGSRRNRTLSKFFNELQANNKPIVVLARVHGYNASIKKAYNYERLIGSNHSPSHDIKINNAHLAPNMLLGKFALARNLHFIEIDKLLDQVGVTLNAVDNLGRLNYIDNDHMSVYGSRWIADTLISNYEPEELKGMFFPRSI